MPRPSWPRCYRIPSSERYPPLDMTPEAQKQRTFEALVELLAGLAAKQPVLAVYEDVHWVDPSTLELLGRVVDRVEHLPVLAIIAFRPEFGPPWLGRSHVTPLPLGRLARRQGASMIEAVAGGRSLPPEVCWIRFSPRPTASLCSLRNLLRHCSNRGCFRRLVVVATC